MKWAALVVVAWALVLGCAQDHWRTAADIIEQLAPVAAEFIEDDDEDEDEEE